MTPAKHSVKPNGLTLLFFHKMESKAADFFFQINDFEVAFFIVSPSFFHVRSAFFSQISPDQTKSAQPRRQAGAARLCAKAKSLLFFLCFCLRNQNGVRSFCTADPVVLAPCLDCSDYSILPKFCKHFLSVSRRFLPPIALFY